MLRILTHYQRVFNVLLYVMTNLGHVVVTDNAHDQLYLHLLDNAHDQLYLHLLYTKSLINYTT